MRGRTVAAGRWWALGVALSSGRRVKKGSAVVGAAFAGMGAVRVEEREGGRMLEYGVAGVVGRTSALLEKGLAQASHPERPAVHWRTIFVGPQPGCCWIDPIRHDHVRHVPLCFLDRLGRGHGLYPFLDHGLDHGLGPDRMTPAAALQGALPLTLSYRGNWSVEPEGYSRRRPEAEYHRNSSP